MADHRPRFESSAGDQERLVKGLTGMQRPMFNARPREWTNVTGLPTGEIPRLGQEGKAIGRVGHLLAGGNSPIVGKKGKAIGLGGHSLAGGNSPIMGKKGKGNQGVGCFSTHG